MTDEKKENPWAPKPTAFDNYVSGIQAADGVIKNAGLALRLSPIEGAVQTQAPETASIPRRKE
jgi:hypothetical protein